jgi:hypothetical protein
LATFTPRNDNFQKLFVATVTKFAKKRKKKKRKKRKRSGGRDPKVDPCTL